MRGFVMRVVAPPLIAGLITEGAHTASQINATATAASGGSGSYTYQWYGDGSPISGATSLTLAWTGRSASTAYSVDLVATDTVTGLQVTYSTVQMTTGAAGSGVTLSGSGFGTKATAAPRFFETFESHDVGTAHSAVGLDSDQPGEGSATVQESRAHSGTKSLRTQYTGASRFPAIGVELNGGLDLYMAKWVYLEVVAGSLAADSDILKLARGGCGVVYSGTPSFYHTVNLRSPGEPSSGDAGYNDGADSTIVTSGFTGPDIDGWRFMEYKYRLSTPGVGDGLYQALIDGALNIDFTSAATRQSGETDELAWVSTVFDGLDYQASNAELDFYQDELLIDTTFARVIATDNATYASSTVWAPQAPSAWSDTEITIAEPNWGALTPGSSAYFHVFDADDNHVAAFARTVPGGGSDNPTRTFFATDFNGSDGTGSFPAPTSNPNGLSWNFHSSSVWGVSDNEAYLAVPDGGGGGQASVSPARKSARIAVTLATHGNGARLVFRYSDGVNWWRIRETATAYELVKSVANVITVLATFGSPADGDRLEAHIMGDHVHAYLNGSLVASVRDNDLRDHTVCGIGAEDSTPRFDDFEITSLPPSVPVVLFEGDSLTHGLGAYPWPFIMADDSNEVFVPLNLAVGGATTTSIATDVNTPSANQDDGTTAELLTESDTTVLTLLIGTNDLTNGRTPADTYADLVSYCQARRSDGALVVAMTLTPQSMQTEVDSLNSLIRANWATFADALVDLAADPRLDDNTDTTYYNEDQLHFNDAGRAVVAELVGPAVEGLLNG